MSEKSNVIWKKRVKNLRDDAEGRQKRLNDFSAWKRIPTVSLRIRRQSVSKDENIRQKGKRKAQRI